VVSAFPSQEHAAVLFLILAGDLFEAVRTEARRRREGVTVIHTQGEE
jgi:hypothetical protein